MSNKFQREQHLLQLPEFEGVIQKALQFFEQTPLLQFPPRPPFPGGGVYALYYLGDFEHYAPLAQINREECRWPIYVGKAVPRGRRTGRTIAYDERKDLPLYRRLQEHARSLKQSNLRTEDFRCRLIILEGMLTDLIVPVESALIRKYKPLWNTTVDGFGNHDPGSGRYNQAPSEWDTLHPGRSWVQRLTGEPPSKEKILEKVRQHFSLYLPRVS